MTNTIFDLAPVLKYVERIGAGPRSMFLAVIKESSGNYWKDTSLIRFTREGLVKCDEGLEPTESEAFAIKEAILSKSWPKCVPVKQPPHWPKEFESAIGTYDFYDENGHYVMSQQRVDGPKGKQYIPWTYWNDDVWRKCEPEGPLPLYNAQYLNEASTVFIHEGAKAADKIQRMIERQTPEDIEAFQNHPWSDDLATGVHVGWIGGALSPHRTNWEIIKACGVKRAFIIADNDKPGENAVREISRRLGIQCCVRFFDQQFPESFDLADEFPRHFFKTIEGITKYVGPSFENGLVPFTWATSKRKVEGSKKPVHYITEEFQDQWTYINEIDRFVCIDFPNMIYSPEVFNRVVASNSDVSHTSRIFLEKAAKKHVSLDYIPNEKRKKIETVGGLKLNRYRPTNIQPFEGNPQPFLDFLEYLVPDETERYHLMRWCATVMARPETKIGYGVLMVSTTQGTGKGTLGERILAPIVGLHNTSFPTDDQISNSGFNGWLANKILCVIGEIYTGHSWKCYNRLKACITDVEIEVNEKFEKPYKINNYINIFACSNSKKAIKIEEQDRRWFYPNVTEEPWTVEQFRAFHKWLDAGGREIIYHWALNFNDYIVRGERPPMTENKKILIEESYSEAHKCAASLAEAANETDMCVAVGVDDLRRWAGKQTDDRIYETTIEFVNYLSKYGLISSKKSIVFNGRRQLALINKNLQNEIEAEQKRQKRKRSDSAIIKSYLTDPAVVMEML